MAIPDYQSLMLPVLKSASAGEIRIADVIVNLANELKLTEEERRQLLPSGKQAVFGNRTHWARFYLVKAGLLETKRHAHIQITDRGRQVLAQNPTRIDNEFLSQFPEFRDFIAGSRGDTGSTRSEQDKKDSFRAKEAVLEARDTRTPDEIMRGAHQSIEMALGQELLNRILGSSPAFFEKVVVDLLVAMGYGGSSGTPGKVLGKSGDNGVDGVIDQDLLGLDRVYIQAKRYAPDNTVGAGEIRDFFGSLDRFRATKGIFLTTSSFSSSARDTAEQLSKRIVLIDAKRLTDLMVRHNIGVRPEETLHIKKLDEDFFSE